MIDSYLKSSGRPGGRSSGRSTPQGKSNFIFILIEYYSKSSGRPGDRSSGRSTPWYRHLVAKSGTNLGPVDLS